MKRKMFRVAVAATVAGLMALAGCGSSGGTSASGTVVKDTITAQVAYSSRDFNPLSTSMALPMSGNWHVTEALVHS